MKSIKEKQMLVKWAKVMNEPIDPLLLEEVERYEQLQKEIVESVREHSLSDLVEASSVLDKPKKELDFPKPPTLEEVLDVLKEDINELVQAQPTEAPKEREALPLPIRKTKRKPSLAEQAADHITKEVKLEEKNSYEQPDAPLTGKSVNDIRKKIKFLEDWISKISLTGPGGGAGDVINLDHPVKLVTSNYTFTRKDYYVGVNSPSSVTITLPDSVGFPGRMVIIKDESGNCSNNPITVDCNVDNDPGGFILAQDNGGIQMIYREGWRIV